MEWVSLGRNSKEIKLLGSTETLDRETEAASLFEQFVLEFSKRVSLGLADRARQSIHLCD